MSERAFPFIRMNEREGKPRTRGITEIRGPYYTPMGKRYLEDVLETMGEYVDSLKFAGGSFTLMPEKQLKEIIELAHRYNVLVSTGGFIEHVLTQGPEIVNRYIEECRNVGFDILEISSGFITFPVDDWLRLVEKVQSAGLKAKPEVGIQFGAGGASAAEELASEGTRDVDWAIGQARRFLDAGAYMIMIESEGITENVKTWRTDAAAKIIGALGLEGDVRGCRPGGLCLVYQELRSRGQRVCRPQPDCPARMPARGHMGDQEPVGACVDLQGVESKGGGGRTRHLTGRLDSSPSAARS